MIEAFPDIALLRIQPVDGGWVLTSGHNDLLQIFRSGADAERQARRYAGVLLRCGYTPRLMIEDRGGCVVRVQL
jgi:hypothetical protein